MISLVTPCLLTGVQQAALTAVTQATTATAGTILKGLIHKLFYNPSLTSVAIFGVLVIGTGVGLALLIKKIYNRCCPELHPKVDLNLPPDTATIDQMPPFSKA